MRVGIIGAGIAGLTLGTRLLEAGHSVLLLDKGRGVGGRTSTRRGDGVAFDHGAQYFTIRDPSFRSFLDDHVPAPDWAPWPGRFATLEADRLVPEISSPERYVGVPGMNAIARALSRALEIRTEVRVSRLAGSAGSWILVDSNGREHGLFDWVIATAPPSQSSALLDGSSPIAEEATRVAMEPCFTLMLALSNGSALPFDGIRCHHPVLGWAANDHSKPGREIKPTLVIQSGHDWAQAHREDNLEAVTRALREAAGVAFDVDFGPNAVGSVHRWLYAKPTKPLGRACLVDFSSRLAIAGDWCVAGKVEGAFLSGEACAQALLGPSAG